MPEGSPSSESPLLAGRATPVILTSLAEADRARIDRLVDAETARTGAGGLSP